MGRQPKNEEDRRQLASFRLSQTDREHLMQHAAMSGRSLAGEIEHRITASLSFDEEGVRLMGALATSIAELEQKAQEGKWHATLTMWTAVREVMRFGPIEEFRPPLPVEDPEATRAMGLLLSAEKQRDDILRKLRLFGLYIGPDHSSAVSRPNNAGEEPELPADGGRSRARLLIEDGPPSDDRSAILKLLDDLASADASIDRALDEFNSCMKPFEDDARKGRDLARDMLREQANARHRRGERANPFHLRGIWQD